MDRQTDIAISRAMPLETKKLETVEIVVVNICPLKPRVQPRDGFHCTPIKGVREAKTSNFGKSSSLHTEQESLDIS